jgi:hypothetical protein
MTSRTVTLSSGTEYETKSAKRYHLVVEMEHGILVERKSDNRTALVTYLNRHIAPAARSTRLIVDTKA